jgi:hypothetical protein
VLAGRQDWQASDLGCETAHGLWIADRAVERRKAQSARGADDVNFILD